MHFTSSHWARPPFGRLSAATYALWAMRLVIAATALKWALSGNVVFAVVGGVCVGLSLLPELLIRHEPLRLHTGLTATGLLLAHVSLGMDGGLYEQSSLYDKAAHTVGSGAIAANLLVALDHARTARGVSLPRTQLAIIAFLAMTSIGVGWELFEFSVDLTGLVSAQKGLTDTMLDFVANTVGAGAALTAMGARPILKTPIN